MVRTATIANSKPRLLVRRGIFEPYDFALVFALFVAVLASLLLGENLLKFRTWMWDHVVAFVTAGLICTAAWAGLRCVWWIISHRTFDRIEIGRILLRHFTPYRVWSIVRVSICIEVMMLIYTLLKQRVPMLNPQIYDDILISVEQMIHFGWNPSWALAEAFPWWINRALDVVYVTWFPVKAIMLAYAITHTNRARGEQFLIAFMSIWILGVMLGIVIPSHGPTYVDPTHFPPQAMPIAQRCQEWLCVHYNVHGTLGGTGMPMYGCGLMAMPSLHVTAASLYAIFCWNEARWMRIVATTFATLIFLGSMVSGWHYAIDGYVGFAIALFAWKLAAIIRDRSASINRGLGSTRAG